MNPRVWRQATSLQDLLNFHVNQDVRQEIEYLNDDPSSSESADQLSKLVTGFREIGIPENAIHLLRLVPIVQIAWAEAAPQTEQRQAVLSAAFDHGVRPGMVAYKLLEIWLNARPDVSIFSVWSDYIGALRWALTDESFEQLRNASILRATTTANAMQTCLGMLRTRQPYQAAIEQISAAFNTSPSR